MSANYGFKLSIDADSDLGAALAKRIEAAGDEQLHELAVHYRATMAEVQVQYLGELRDDIRGGGFKNADRLANTWRGATYPQQPSMSPAAYFKNQAELILDAFELGVTITAGSHKFLAIPQGPAKAIVRRLNQASNRSRNGDGTFADEAGTVERVRAELGVPKLVAKISKDGQHGVLVAPGRSLTAGGRDSRAKGARDDTVLFVLTKQATLRKRIQGRALIAELQRRFPGDFTRRLAARLGPQSST